MDIYREFTYINLLEWFLYHHYLLRWCLWGLGLHQWLSSKESTCNAGDVELIPGLGRFLGGGNGYLLQYSWLGNPWTEEPGGLQSLGLLRVGYD